MVVTVRSTDGGIFRYVGVIEAELPSNRAPYYTVKMAGATEYINKDSVRTFHVEPEQTEVV